MIIPDIAGIVNSWWVARHFYKKSSEDMAGAFEDLKADLSAKLTRMLEPLLKQASQEQRATMMSTVESTTAALVRTYIKSVHEPFSMKATVETKAPPDMDIIGPSGGKSER